MVDRMLAIYHGTVQGVGFRYTVLSLVRRFEDITGYVRNKSDGTVELCAEGDKRELLRLSEEVNVKMALYISDINLLWEFGERKHSGFRIAR